MWFKNLALFRFTESFPLTAAELESKLEQMKFRSCGNHEQFSIGWTTPLGRAGQQLVHASNGFMMFCMQKEEKVLPASVVNEIVLEKIQQAEEQQARKLAKKERSAVKDEVVFELLPKAFSFSRYTYAYIDPQGGWLLVDAASANKAEDLVSLLRKCLGTLPVIPPNTVTQPATTMTGWLDGEMVPADIVIEDECELRAPDQEGGIIHCKRQDLSQPEIKNHLNSGKKAVKLAVSWADRLSFIIDESLSIKRLRFLDLIQEQAAEIDSYDEQQQFDVDFSIMSLELAGFLPRLLELFGGENKTS